MYHQSYLGDPQKNKKIFEGLFFLAKPELFGDLDLLDEASSHKTNSSPALPHLIGCSM